MLAVWWKKKLDSIQAQAVGKYDGDGETEEPSLNREEPWQGLG